MEKKALLFDLNKTPPSSPDESAPASDGDGDAPASDGDGDAPTANGDGDAPAANGDGDDSDPVNGDDDGPGPAPPYNIGQEVYVYFHKRLYKAEGHRHTYQFCDNVWTFILQDAVFKSDECQETVGHVKIEPCDSKLLTQ